MSYSRPDQNYMRNLKKFALAQETNSDRIFDGTVEVRNGELIINPPRGFGRFPRVMAGENVMIIYQGQEAAHPIVASDQDSIQIFTRDTEPRINFKVHISEDQLRVNLTIEKIPGKKYALIDSKPMRELKIMAKCESEEEPDPPEFGTVMNVLMEHGVVFGIDEEAIRCGIRSEQVLVSIEAAHGIEPGLSEDAAIIYNLEENLGEQVVNPYGHKKIHSVSVGGILAIKRPAVQGSPGVGVTGQEIPARTPQDVQIRIKEGAKLIHDGMVAIATRSGRPALEGLNKQYISVRPIYVVEGNVDLSVGNIEFEGDIIILDSVLDGFTVKAGGSIQVYGDVLHAFLFANGNISINKKVISSKLQAGCNTLAYKKISKLLLQISQRLEDMIMALQQIKSQPSFTSADLFQKGDGQLIQLLIDFRFKDVPKLIQDLIHIILSESDQRLLQSVVEIAQELGKNLCNLGPMRIREDREIETLRDKVKSALEQIDLIISDSANISFSYAQNSDIKASGNVAVTGQGVITSRLEAGAKITVAQGIVRGGELIARDLIKVSELGSTQDAEVNIYLMENCSLQANTVRPSIIIKHGTKVRIIQEMGRNLRAYVENNQLIVVENKME